MNTVKIATATIRIKGCSYQALLDSGSSISIISNKLAQTHDLPKFAWDLGLSAMMDGSKTTPTSYTRVKFHLGNKKFLRNFVIINSNIPVVLGLDFMSSKGISLNFDNSRLSFKGQPNISFPFLISETAVHSVNSIRVLTNIEQVKIENLLTSFPDLIDTSLGKVKGYEHVITLTENKPKRFNAYPTTPIKSEEIDRQVQEMLKSGLIRTSKSPWASPVLLRPKPNGDWRFITDFSYVNQYTVTDSFPMVKIQDILKNLGKAKYITTLDAEKGYWQVPVAESSKQYTAFRTRKGLYEYNVMPFGLKNAPATYQRIMNEVLEGLHPFTLVYQDDIIIFSESFTDHMNHLRQVFERLRKANITLTKRKCTFGVQSVKFLGHIISTEGIKMNPEKVNVLKQFPQPKTRKELKRFLGVTNFYHHFVQQIGSVATPLHAACSLKSKFYWGPLQEEAY